MTQPVLPGFYPDPSICRVDDTYYLISSSFEYLPGIPIHASTDLVSWTRIGNALTRPSQVAESPGYPSSGIFAATIRHHAGRFWIIGTNVNEIPEGRGHFLIHSDDPAGEWSDPIHITPATGIDPDIVWDDDGIAHVTWCSLDPNAPGILSAPVDTATGAMLGSARPLWEGTGLAAPEGPHLYRIGDWWYLVLAEGGTERGHTATIARSRTLHGSFEPAPHNPFLSHRSLAHPVQSVGHADLIELPDGSWAAVHLGTRPVGPSPGFHVNGRETFIVGIDWHNGWPVPVEDRFVVPNVDRSFDESFSDDCLHARWLGVGRFPSSFTSHDSRGGLVIDASAAPALLAARATDTAWNASARFTTQSGEGRFIVRIDEHHAYTLSYDGTNVDAALTIGPTQQPVGRWKVPDGATPTLTIRVRPARLMPHGISLEPDRIELAASAGGEHQSFGDFDGRYVSTEVAGGFTGRVFGVEARRGRIHLHNITYSPTSSDPHASA